MSFSRTLKKKRLLLYHFHLLVDSSIVLPTSAKFLLPLFFISFHVYFSLFPDVNTGGNSQSVLGFGCTAIPFEWLSEYDSCACASLQAYYTCLKGYTCDNLLVVLWTSTRFNQPNMTVIIIFLLFRCHCHYHYYYDSFYCDISQQKVHPKIHLQRCCSKIENMD